jgi:hypothetical protein
MSLPLVVRRALAVTSATALLSTGGAAGGLLGTALAAAGDPAVASTTPAADNNTNSTATAVTINGAGFVPSTDTVKFVPNQGSGTFPTPLPTDVSPITATVVSNGSTSTPTALKVTVPLALAAPGAYDVVVTQGLTGSPVACTCLFTVTSNGAPDTNNVVPGASTGSTGRGAGALDLTGAFYAKGAKVTFLLPGSSTVDAGLAFTPGDPNNSTASSTGGYVNSGLIRGNYSFPASTTFTPGKHNLQVTNTDKAAGATVEFWQPLFAASGVSPTATGAGSQNRVVTVAGQGIRSGSSLAIQSLATSGNPADVTSAGPATVNAAGTSISQPFNFLGNAKTGTLRSIGINGPEGASYSVAGVFKVNAAPVISGLSVSALGQGAVTDVAISGSDFATGGLAGLPSFTFSGTGVTGVTKSVSVSTVTTPPSTTPTTVTTALVAVTVARDATTDGRNVTVTNPDGGSTTLAPTGTPPSAAPLTINAGPVISSVSPGSSPRGTTKSIVLTGTGFDKTNGMDVVFSVPPVAGATRTRDSSLAVGTVTITKGTSPALDTASFNVTISPDAAFGLRDISLLNKGDSGQYLCAGCFGIDVLSVSPSTAAGNNTGAKSVTFTGTGIPTGSTVQLVRSGDPAYQPHLSGSNVVVSADNTTLTALFDLTGAAPGAYNAVVTQGSTVLSCSGCFTVTGSSPSLTSLTPNSGGQGTVNRVLALAGTSFSRGEQVTIAGTTVHDITFVSPTKLTAQVDIPAGLATGAIDVVVTNADGVGTSKLTNGFTVTAAPAVSAVSPTSYGQGAKAQTITVTGPGFVTGASGAPSSTVSFGPGVTVTNVVVTQGTVVPVLTPNPADTLTATVTILENAAATARDVTVTNPDGGVGVLVKGFTVNLGPKVTSVLPTALAPGSSGKPITITGNGFSTTSGKTAMPTIAGVTLTSPVVSADGTTITAMAAVATGQAKGTPDVVVTNPTDQGIGTCAGCFAIATPPSAPLSPRATAGPSQGQAVVTWSAPSDNGGTPVTSYVVTAAGPNGSPTANGVTVDGSTLTATITGLSDGVTYTVSIIARNAVGSSPAANTTVAGTATPPAGQVSISTSDGGPLAGQQSFLTVVGTPGAAYDVVAANRPSSTFLVAHRGVLDGNGRSVFEVHPLNNVNFIARSGGVSSAQVIMSVHTALNIAVKKSGHTLTFYGQIYPNNRAQTVYIKTGNTIVGRAVRDSSGKNWIFTHDFSSGAGKSVVFYSYTASDTQNANGHSSNLRATL